jgi:hypothetical protein
MIHGVLVRPLLRPEFVTALAHGRLGVSNREVQAFKSDAIRSGTIFRTHDG